MLPHPAIASDNVTREPDPNALAEQLIRPREGLPPVNEWDPPFCGDMDLRIARDGSWHYLGSPIGRQALVRLFSTVLRRDDDGAYYLVTPVEKVRITVDDAPFVAVGLEVEGDGQERRLCFVTNVGDRVVADAAHPLRVTFADDGEPAPYVRVRDRLDALVSRAVYFELAELGCARAADDGVDFGVWSSGCFFPLGRLEGMRDVPAGTD
jgi:hypothetical protein